MLLDVFENIRDFCERMYWQWPDSVTEHGEGYVFNYSGLVWLSGANQVWLDDARVVTPLFLERCSRFFRPYRAEWSIPVMPAVQPGLKDYLVRLGGFIRWESPILVLDGLPRTQPHSRLITVRPVRGELMERQAQRILTEAFHLDYGVNVRLIRPEHENEPTLHHYMAYYDRHPAAVATLTFTNGMAGIWNVGTRKMFRRRGLASVLMAQVCYDAYRAGYSQTMLMASSMGQPLYEKMGYHAVADIVYLGLASY